MLHLPANCGETFTIAGCDPGTHNLGLGLLHVDMSTFKLRSFEAYTLIATKLMNDNDWLVETHGHMYARTHAHREKLTQLFCRYRPSAVACEDAFFSRRTPGAFMPLLNSINSIRQAVIDWNPNIPFTLIEASIIKSAVQAKSGGGKEAVLDGIMKIDEFRVPSSTPLTLLSEHAIDGLAIAYARLKQMR